MPTSDIYTKTFRNCGNDEQVNSSRLQWYRYTVEEKGRECYSQRGRLQHSKRKSEDCYILSERGREY